MARKKNDKLLTDSTVSHFSINRLMAYMNDNIDRSVRDRLDKVMDNPHTVIGRMYRDTDVKLKQLRHTVNRVYDDTQYMRKAMMNMEKKLKKFKFGSGSGGAGSSSGAGFLGGIASALPWVAGAAFTAWMVKKSDKRIPDAAIVVGSAAQRGLSQAAVNMSDDIARVGSTVIRNPITVRIVKTLEKYAKVSKYSGVVAMVLLNAIEPYLAWSEGKPESVVKKEIVGAIANVLGTIVGMQIGGAIGGGAGAALFGVGSIPGAAIGVLLGGIVGYLSGEGLEFLAEQIYDALVNGNTNITEIIEKHVRGQKRTIPNGRGKMNFTIPKAPPKPSIGGRGIKPKATSPSIPSPTSSLPAAVSGRRSRGAPILASSIPTSPFSTKSKISAAAGAAMSTGPRIANRFGRPMSTKNDVLVSRIDDVPMTVDPRVGRVGRRPNSIRPPTIMDQYTGRKRVAPLPLAGGAAMASLNQGIYVPQNRLFRGFDVAMGSYLTDQRNQMPSMFGGRFISGVGQAWNGKYGSGGSYVGSDYIGDFAPSTLSDADEKLWSDISSGKSVASSSSLAKFSDDQLASIGIKRITTYGGDRHMPSTSYVSALTNEEINANITSGKGGKSREAQAYAILKQAGRGDIEIAGLLGSWKHEGGFDESVISGKTRGDGGAAWGLSQWHLPRQRMFEKVMGKPISQATFEDQVKFADWELNNTYKKAGNALKAAKTPEEAARIADEAYEQSAGLTTDARMKSARSYYENLPQYAKESSMSTADLAKLSPEQKAQMFADSRAALMQRYRNNFANMLYPNGKSSAPGKYGSDRIIENQGKSAGVRKGKLQSDLVDKMNYSASAASNQFGLDIRFKVTSGGQRMPGAPGATGTHQHDKGWAGDFNAVIVDPKTGKETVLDYRNSQHRPILASLGYNFTKSGGKSMGLGYMSDPTKIHFGANPTSGGALVYNKVANQSWFADDARRGQAEFLKNGAPVATSSATGAPMLTPPPGPDSGGVVPISTQQSNLTSSVPVPQSRPDPVNMIPTPRPAYAVNSAPKTDAKRLMPDMPGKMKDDIVAPPPIPSKTPLKKEGRRRFTSNMIAKHHGQEPASSSQGRYNASSQNQPSGKPADASGVPNNEHCNT